jgi:bacteriorhodopsin
MTESAKKEKKKSISFMLILWYMAMFLCTLALHALGVITQDNSGNSYVAIGILAMIGVPVVNLISAMIKNNELRKEAEERDRKAAERRRAKLDEEERLEQEKEKSRASMEFARRHAEQVKGAKSA